MMKKLNGLALMRTVLLPIMTTIMICLHHVGILPLYADEPMMKSHSVEEAPWYVKRKAVIPPAKTLGIPEEKLEVIESLEPLETRCYDVYLNKFVVYTMDSVAVMKTISDPSLVKKVGKDFHGQWEMRIDTEDPQLGIRMKNQLETTRGVVRIENCVYEKGHELTPLPIITVKLKNVSDSTIIKEYVGVKELLAFPIFEEYWSLQLTPNTRGSRIELMRDILFQNLPIDYIQLEWDDNVGVIPHFTFDPEIEAQWGMYNLDNITIPSLKKYTDLDISRAWNLATGHGVTICIIEQGMNTSIEDLAGQVEACYDASSDKSFVPQNDNHGTACATVACAVRNNNYGIAGVSPDSKLLVASYKNNTVTVGSEKRDIQTQLVKAINWAVDNGADIINCSWGFSEKPMLTAAFNRALTTGRNGRGCVILSSSGNEDDGKITYPATIPGVLAIGSVNKNIVIDPKSCYGSSLFAVAPGVDMPVLMANGKVEKHSGTSLACPAVAGVAALVLEVYPEATTEQVAKILGMTSTLPLGITKTKDGEYGPWNDKYGYGLVNAYEAVRLAVMLRNGRVESVPEVPFPDISSLQ